jgi:acetyl-CoA carboxylase biotin carboxyl carrier protein
VSDKFSIDEIASILEMLSRNDVTEFKLERGEEKIHLRRGPRNVENKSNNPPTLHLAPTHGHLSSQIIPFPGMPVEGGTSPGYSSESPQQVAPKSAPSKSNLKEISSPMVGTFYRKPAVDAPVYVEVGSIVKKGDVLCIVEAMKLMNEIQTDIAGKIVEICLEDAQMVEYGEVLFRIEPTAS